MKKYSVSEAVADSGCVIQPLWENAWLQYCHFISNIMMRGIIRDIVHDLSKQVYCGWLWPVSLAILKWLLMKHLFYSGVYSVVNQWRYFHCNDYCGIHHFHCAYLLFQYCYCCCAVLQWYCLLIPIGISVTIVVDVQDRYWLFIPGIDDGNDTTLRAWWCYGDGIEVIVVVDDYLTVCWYSLLFCWYLIIAVTTVFGVPLMERIVCWYSSILTTILTTHSVMPVLMMEEIVRHCCDTLVLSIIVEVGNCWPLRPTVMMTILLMIIQMECILLSY